MPASMVSYFQPIFTISNQSFIQSPQININSIHLTYTVSGFPLCMNAAYSLTSFKQHFPVIILLLSTLNNLYK